MAPTVTRPTPLANSNSAFSWKAYFMKCWAPVRANSVLRYLPSVVVAIGRTFILLKMRIARLFEHWMYPNRKRKALLIGIRKGGEELPLTRPHEDVADMRKLLIKIYGYKSEDIMIMLDDGGVGEPQMIPTHANILRAIDDLVAGAQSGDHFVFHFSGHSMQVPNKTGTEDDGMDEAIIPCDDKEIIDNILRERLVDPLPVGSSLVAIFDTCHSASLLDLTHHRCNRIVPREGEEGCLHLPWTPVAARMSIYHVSPPSSPASPRSAPVDGEHKSRALPRRGRKLSRKTTLEITPPTTKRPTRVSITSRSYTVGAQPEMERWREFGSPITAGTGAQGMEAILEGDQIRTDEGKSVRWLDDSEVMRCRSPERVTHPPACDGGRMCEIAKEQLFGKFANVIALGACKDAQLTWEDEKRGKTMTAVLVEHLEKNPLMPLEELMRRISNATYENVDKMHHDWEEYKQEAERKHVQVPTDMDYSKEWQDPQLASHWKLDMKMPFSM